MRYHWGHAVGHTYAHHSLQPRFSMVADPQHGPAVVCDDVVARLDFPQDMILDDGEEPQATAIDQDPPSDSDSPSEEDLGGNLGDSNDGEDYPDVEEALVMDEIRDL